MADMPLAPVPTATDGPVVRIERKGPVATLVLDSPRNRNALSQRLLAELVAALRSCTDDGSVRVVVLTGTGSTFCSGVDLRERLDPPPPGGATVPELLSALAGSPTPVVARVNGHVRAGGMGLVASCDMAVAPEEATFAFSEVRVGVAPAMIAVPALRVVGRRALARYALTGERFDAREAADCGLLTAAVPAAALDGWVHEVVTGLLQSSPAAVGATKRLLDDLAGRPWAEAMEAAATESDRLFAGADAAEGMAAFLQKRPPSWVDTGR